MTGPAEPGRPVRLQRDTGSAAQVWEITHPRNRSRTEIINKRTGLCLDAVRHAAGARLITVICTGSRHQQWTQRRPANGTWRLSQGSSGPVLQAASAGTSVRLAPRTRPAIRRNWLRHTTR
jgi:Ricin-type beta-trefoil lectin domain-like